MRNSLGWFEGLSPNAEHKRSFQWLLSHKSPLECKWYWATFQMRLQQLQDFIKRPRKLTGSNLVQTPVFGWLDNPESTYEELAQTVTTVNLTLTPQAIEQRFTPEAADTLKQQSQPEIELSVRLGVKAQLSCRLLAQRIIVDEANKRLSHLSYAEWLKPEARHRARSGSL